MYRARGVCSARRSRGYGDVLSYEERRALRAALDAARRAELAKVTRLQQAEPKCLAYALSGRACRNQPRFGAFCGVHRGLAGVVVVPVAA